MPFQPITLAELSRITGRTLKLAGPSSTWVWDEEDQRVREYQRTGWNSASTISIGGKDYPQSYVVCVRCARLHSLPICANCGGSSWAVGLITGLGSGLVCDQCKLGVARWTCSSCHTSNPYASTLRDLEVEPSSEMIAAAKAATERKELERHNERQRKDRHDRGCALIISLVVGPVAGFVGGHILSWFGVPLWPAGVTIALVVVALSQVDERYLRF